jgi:hypothetical protein
MAVPALYTKGDLSGLRIKALTNYPIFVKRRMAQQVQGIEREQDSIND